MGFIPRISESFTFWRSRLAWQLRPVQVRFDNLHGDQHGFFWPLCESLFKWSFCAYLWFFFSSYRIRVFSLFWQLRLSSRERLLLILLFSLPDGEWLTTLSDLLTIIVSVKFDLVLFLFERGLSWSFRQLHERVYGIDQGQLRGEGDLLLAIVLSSVTSQLEVLSAWRFPAGWCHSPQHNDSTRAWCRMFRDGI